MASSLAVPNQDVLDAIRRAASEHGVDPALALAVAERESSFNPSAGSGSKYSSATGIIQILRGERTKYGGSSSDPYEQATAWMNYIKPVQQEMSRVLGRDPTGSETYLGHYFGGTRAAKMIAGHYHPDTPVEHVFTPNEMAANPNFGRAGTVGNLTGSILGDVERRTQKFGGVESGTPYREAGAPDSPKEMFSGHGERVAGGPMFPDHGELVQEAQVEPLPPVQTFEGAPA